MSKEELYKAAENGNTATVGELAPKLTQADIDWQNPNEVSNAKSVHTNTHIWIYQYLYPQNTCIHVNVYTHFYLCTCIQTCLLYCVYMYAYYPNIYIYVLVYAVCMHKCISFHFIFELFWTCLNLFVLLMFTITCVFCWYIWTVVYSKRQLL